MNTFLKPTNVAEIFAFIKTLLYVRKAFKRLKQNNNFGVNLLAAIKSFETQAGELV